MPLPTLPAPWSQKNDSETIIATKDTNNSSLSRYLCPLHLTRRDVEDLVNELNRAHETRERAEANLNSVDAALQRETLHGSIARPKRVVQTTREPQLYRQH